MKDLIKKYDKRMSKILKRLDTLTEKFCCEICHKKIARKYEGTEPNTCEMCMPKKLPEISTKNHWAV